jgi:hypothetical protein
MDTWCIPVNRKRRVLLHVFYIITPLVLTGDALRQVDSSVLWDAAEVDMLVSMQQWDGCSMLFSESNRHRVSRWAPRLASLPS